MKATRCVDVGVQKTSTGKILKTVLRQRAKEEAEKELKAKAKL